MEQKQVIHFPVVPILGTGRREHEGGTKVIVLDTSWFEILHTDAEDFK